jgi:hypothetical protein
MTRVAFAALPAYGHLLPMVPLAQAFQRRGAEVRIASAGPVLERLPIPAQRGFAPDITLDDLTGRALADFPALRDDPDRRWPAVFFGRVNAALAMPHLREAWSEWRPDLVVYDATNAGAAVVADELGIPRIAFGILDWAPLIGVLPELARLALEPVDAVPPPWEQAETVLASSPDSVAVTYLDPFPLRWRSHRRPVPHEVLDLKPVAFSLEGSEGIPPERLGRDRPLVYVTLGTVANRRVEALRAAILGAASLDVDVLVAAGPDAEPAMPDDLPPNVTVRGWVDQPAVLARTAVAIHHAGTGTLSACAAAGVPQLLLPQLADQPHNAERVAEIGPGRVLRRDEVTADAVTVATAELLAEGPHRAECAALSREIAAMPPPDEVAAGLLARIGR